MHTHMRHMQHFLASILLLYAPSWITEPCRMHDYDDGNGDEEICHIPEELVVAVSL